MKLYVENRENFKHVKVQDERLDVLLASKLKEEVLSLMKNHVKKDVVLDISRCSYCDASGLGAINAAYKFYKNADVRLIIMGIQPNVGKLVKICCLNSVWTIANNLNEADALLKQSA